ncbi:hypothetical protein [Streptomyces anulatus]|uniref:hypothetical protein n=1 Tax=Streptomyces anulatus TaxID=1892 RepID=UPI00224F60B7|nr:hypothetical protein [Streptomyces anulatus]MCX4504582.1 hypothetical protein [Streptomyces anulatus]
MIKEMKKAPEGAFKRPGEPSVIVPLGPDGRVVRTVFLPNTRRAIEAGAFHDGIMAPAGSVVVLDVGNGNRMDRFTARIVGNALALCSYIQVQGDDLGRSFCDEHYFYGLEAILHGIRQAAVEEADLRQLREGVA